MHGRDRIELALLGAIWGASFLFMRVATPAFGPVPLIALRVSIAALLLGGALGVRGRWHGMRGHTRPLLVLGLLNSALPFSLFAYATLTLTAGVASILNSTVPLFGALIGGLWFGERLSPRRAAGLGVGFLGVVLLVSGEGIPRAEAWAIGAGLAAAIAYGYAAHYTRRRLHGVDPLAIAAGSQLAASLWLAPVAMVEWPAASPPPLSWLCGLALGVVCTGLAYLLYFRLISRTGPTRAMAVAYLIPLFGVCWGALLLDEPLTPAMFVGGALILGGTAAVTGAARTPAATATLTSTTR